VPVCAVEDNMEVERAGQVFLQTVNHLGIGGLLDQAGDRRRTVRQPR
jgi:hypothetical protein